MSETLTAPPVETAAPSAAPTPVTDVSPVITQVETPSPMTGTAPEAAPSPAAPAPSSPTEAATSLLSSAKSEAPPPAEAPAAEVTPEVQQPAPELPLPSYEKFTLPEGVELDEKPLGEFTNLLGEYERRISTTPAEAHQAAQELGQKVIDLYVAESQTQAQRFAEANRLAYQRMREDWISKFKDDPEIGNNRQDTTMARCGAVLELYGRRVGSEREQALRDVMALTGAGDNPEMLRFINWAANFVVESARPVPAQGATAPIQGSRAARLYRASIPMNGAA